MFLSAQLALAPRTCLISQSLVTKASHLLSSGRTKCKHTLGFLFLISITTCRFLDLTVPWVMALFWLPWNTKHHTSHRCYPNFKKRMSAPSQPHQKPRRISTLGRTNYMDYTVWTNGCRSWYQDRKNGNRISALWPGSTLHYIETIQKPGMRIGNGSTSPVLIPGRFWAMGSV